MFDIEYKGGNTVAISTKSVSFVFDPKQSVVGLKDLTVKGAVQLTTEERLRVSDDAYRLILDGPGEYEVSEVSIHAIAVSRHIDDPSVAPVGTMYRMEIGGVRVAVLGNIAPKLSEDQLEGIGVVDVVVIPVGGAGYTLDATSAAQIVRQLEPKAVIPVHYADPALTYEVPQGTLETFTAELGAPVESAGSKYKLKGAAGLPQTLTVLALDRS